MHKKKEDHLKIHLPAEDSESEPDEEETPEQRGNVEDSWLVFVNRGTIFQIVVAN